MTYAITAEAFALPGSANPGSRSAWNNQSAFQVRPSLPNHLEGNDMQNSRGNYKGGQRLPARWRMSIAPRVQATIQELHRMTIQLSEAGV